MNTDTPADRPRTFHRRAMTLSLLGAVLVGGLAGCAPLDLGGDAGSAAPRPGVTVTLPAAPPAAHPSVPASASASVSVSTTPTSTPASNPSPTPRPTAQPVRTTLVMGDRGPRVLELQQRLADLGYWLGAPDGTFGSHTQQAVYAVQKAAGIGRDGTVGPQTRAALASGIRPRARTTSGDAIEIDLERQLLLIVRDGRVARILNTSTGNGETYLSRGRPAIARTPKGTYSVYRSVNGPDKGPLGTLWRPRYFNGGIAVHGSPSIPPYAASHGCARLSNAAMDMIWTENYMPIGTTVIVR